MSHFVVLVIGECPDKQLERYHEFECTGDDNEYVVDMDITDEVRQEFAQEFAESKVSRLRDQDGKYHDPYDKEFYRELSLEEAAQYNPITGFHHAEYEDMKHLQVSTQDWDDGRGVRPKVRFIPDGWEVVQVPRAEVESFLEYAEDYHGRGVVPFGTEPDLAGEHKYGYTIVDAENNVVKIVRRTNQSAKWDWYQIGGRWTGWLKLKTSHNAVARLGKPGLMTPPAEPGHADQTLFCNIDVEGMRQDAANKAAEEFDRVAPAFAGKTIPSWNELREAHKDNIDAARKLHREDPVYQDMVKLDRDVLFHMGDLRDYFCNGDREAFVDRARKGAIVPFAIVKEGKWYQRGEMGWWGVVTDEQDRDEWGAQVSKLLDELPGETLVTVVDCHI